MLAFVSTFNICGAHKSMVSEYSNKGFPEVDEIPTSDGCLVTHVGCHHRLQPWLQSCDSTNPSRELNIHYNWLCKQALEASNLKVNNMHFYFRNEQSARDAIICVGQIKWRPEATASHFDVN